jgi:hypothetical protein
MEKTILGIETASSALSVAGSFIRNVADIVGVFVPLVSNITRTVHEIQILCETIEYNKRMCATLLERALFAEKLTKALMTRPDYYEEKLKTFEFYKEFQKFTGVIEKIKNFVKNVSQISGELLDRNNIFWWPVSDLFANKIVRIAKVLSSVGN